ncbi:hypothetical protein P3S68_003315 [Capsicum galapagoense]
MDNTDYLNYLCSLGYSNAKVQNATTYFTKNNSTAAAAAGGIICPKEVPSRLNLNLPSIAIPNLKNSVTIRRNTLVKVSPNVLKFNSKTKKISFMVNITSTLQRSNKYNFGSLAWTDDKHYVRIPIAVRKQV